MRRRRATDGFSLVELLVACACLAVVAAAFTLPVAASFDGARARQAAVFLVGEFEQARAAALTRSVAVGVYFGPDRDGTPFTMHLDGNGNGVRSAEVQRGVDPPIAPARRLQELFPGVRIADGDASGVRLGATRVLTFSPLGSATPGSVVVTGRHGTRYAVRVSGGSARLRVQRYNATSGVWADR